LFFVKVRNDKELILKIINVNHIKVDDAITLIESKKDISIEWIIYQSNTIANELLSRLGNRVTDID